MSKRLQQSVGWKGPAVVLAIDSPSKAHTCHRGVPVLVTTEQLRMASRGELETYGQGDLMDQLLERTRNSVRQRGFLDFRGRGPEEQLEGEVKRPRREAQQPQEHEAPPPEPPRPQEEPPAEVVPDEEDDGDVTPGGEERPEEDISDEEFDNNDEAAADPQRNEDRASSSGLRRSNSVPPEEARGRETRGHSPKRSRTALKTAFWTEKQQHHQKAANDRRRRRGTTNEMLEKTIFLCKWQIHLVQKKGRELKKIPPEYKG